MPEQNTAAPQSEPFDFEGQCSRYGDYSSGTNGRNVCRTCAEQEAPTPDQLTPEQDMVVYPDGRREVYP